MSVSISAANAIDDGYVAGFQAEKIEPRLEIDEFVLDRDVLNLFLLALIELQLKDSDDPWSWFQIAGKIANYLVDEETQESNHRPFLGIHGRPFTNWDNVGPKPIIGDTASEKAGYCSHSSVTFPTWHRAYVVMMEVIAPVCSHLVF
jgi:tyrosinase